MLLKMQKEEDEEYKRNMINKHQSQVLLRDALDQQLIDKRREKVSDAKGSLSMYERAMNKDLMYNLVGSEAGSHLWDSNADKMTQ